MASTTNSVSSGWTASRMSAAWRISSASTPRRPAVSTITTSCWSARARSMPARATATGSPNERTPSSLPLTLPGSGAKTTAPARSPTICSWFTAFGRCRSAATSIGVWPSDRSQRASFPASVVLPDPWRPASMITVGGFLANSSRRVSPPSTVTSSSLTILTTCWAGFSAPLTSAPERPLADGRGELADDRQGDVGVEQRPADLLHGGGDVLLGQAALAAEVLEGRVEAVGEGGEHAPSLPSGHVEALRAAGRLAGAEQRTEGGAHPGRRER